MKTRMQPIGNVWIKFPRVVRDVAHELGKDVQLVVEVQDTELDRTIIEAIKDPLTHIVRNAIDLGRVKQKAIEKGIANAEQISRMSEREILNLIFCLASPLRSR